MGNMTDLVRNRRLMQKFNNLSGLRFGNLYPTDIDGFLEVRNKLFVFIETKYDNANVPLGQERALVNLVDSLHDPERDKHAYCLVVSYKNSHEIDVGAGIVVCYRVNGHWVDIADMGYTCREFVYNLINIHIQDKI